MGKKRNSKGHRRAVIPPVGNGGITKKHQSSQQAPSIIVPAYSQPDNCQIPGYPILNFPVRVVPGPGPSTSAAPSRDPNPYQQPPLPGQQLPSLWTPTTSVVPFPPPIHLPPPPSSPPFAAPSVILLPPHGVAPSAHVQVVTLDKSPRNRKKKNAPVTVAVQSAPKGSVSEATTKKAQLKYAKQLAARANKRKSAAAQAEVKTEPEEPAFNLFMNIAQRYRSVQKSPDAIDIPDDSEVDDDDVEEIEQQNGAAASNMTIVEDMSICTVDEVGEATMVAVEEEGGEAEEEIVCLGEQKSKHVLTEVVVLDDDDEECEVEEIDVSDESMDMNKAFSEKESQPPMEAAIIDLSLEDAEKEKVASGAELPDFMPLIEGEKEKGDRRRNRSISNGKQKQQPQQSVFTQPPSGAPPAARVVQHSNGGTQLQNAPASFPFLVGMTRSKSNKERKRDNYRKKAETRAMDLGASPSSVARAVAASTCSFPPVFTPSKIPLPFAAAPPTPLARLYSCPPGSSSAMGFVQSRGFSTSAPQSQPVNFRDYGMVHPPSSLVRGVGGVSSSPPTIAAALYDDATGVVNDSLSANGIFRRQWEQNWMHPGSASFGRADTKVDPSAAPFRICSYNVLCQKTIQSTEYLYKHARFQPHVLEWAHRWPLIQNELRGISADIFGLQEIQDVHFEEFYEPYMKSLGYSCHYQRKSETLHSDGLGIFVKSNRFKITSTKMVDFLVPGDNLMNRGNVAQLLRVECLQTGASLIITNTHIIFNEKRGDIKLAQIALLMANIHAMRQDGEPVVCLGDWNLEPESDLYNYITRGRLDGAQFVPKYGSGQVREGRNFNMAPMRELPMDTHLKTRMSREGVLYQNEGSLLQSLQRSHPTEFSHQIPLTSAYSPYQERCVSTFHKDVANPDFIFYTTAGRGEPESHRLRLIRRLAVPPEAGIRQHLEPWPNHHVPSDHIPLVAEFYLAK